eukprot:Gb_12903 [translate_table: standard]
MDITIIDSIDDIRELGCIVCGVVVMKNVKFFTPQYLRLQELERSVPSHPCTSSCLDIIRGDVVLLYKWPYSDLAFQASLSEDQLKGNVKYEEEFILSSRGLKLFTCRWVPADQEPKALICLCHGYGIECSIFMQDTGVRLANAGYAVIGIDYEGHGKSAGTRCYIQSFQELVNDVAAFFKSIAEREEYKQKARFLYGESMGGAVALLIHRKQPSYWNGAVLVAPMCKIAEELKPHPMVVSILKKLTGLIPTWKIVPTQDILNVGFKLPEKRQEVTLPFLVLHGEADVVTDPAVSKLLYESAQSFDKTLKLYPDMWHSLTFGEPPEHTQLVFSDITAWLDKRSTDGCLEKNNEMQKKILNDQDGSVMTAEREQKLSNDQLSTSR